MKLQILNLYLVLCFVALLYLSSYSVESANILSISFIASKSHKITYEPLLYELAARGHQVTIVSQSPTNRKAKNVREILTVDADEALKKLGNVFEKKENNEEINPFKLLKLFGEFCEEGYDNPEVQKLLNQKFDLVFTEALFNECVAGIVHKLNTSLILLSVIAAPPHVAHLLGTPAPPSFVPGILGSFTDKMNFYERTMNFIAEGMLKMLRDYSFKPGVEAIYRKKLNDPAIPDSDDVYRNASMVFSISHFSIGAPRPYLPDIVEVGGMHLNPAKPLPQDLKTFADSAGSDGFIFFSLGSAIKGSEMPEKNRQLFLRVFSKLKQKVFWKWETETMEGLPPNVKLGKWMPQQDILGHPNCKLFITHGGLGGTTEAIYHGIPMVGIPMFGDQMLNMRKSEGAGYAVSIEYNDLTEENLYEAIVRVIGEPKYKNKIQHLSNVYRDQLDKPLDRAVFWVEYVLRHKGATHLRSPARDLNFFQYFSLDVIGALLAAIFIAIYMIFATIRFLVRKVCGSGSSKTKSSVNGSKKKTN